MKNNSVLNLPIPGVPGLNRQRGLLYLLKKVPYETAWRWQKRLVMERKEAKTNRVNDVSSSADVAVPPDVLILLEHPPVYTLGQGADDGFLRFDPERDDYELHRIERGGEVTYHCPGQIVGYPILDLQRHQQDLHWYLRQLEEVVIRTLGCYGLKGNRISGLTGVWVEGRKVAAVGIKVSRWITMHGVALNVCPDLSGFERIVPCGIEGRPVGSMAQFLPAVELLDVRQRLSENFEQVFGLDLTLMPVSDELKHFAS